MSKKYNIAQFGAFDVSSFGDSLFPTVTKFELQQRIEIGEFCLFSPIGTDNAYNFNGKVYAYENFEEVNKIIGFDAIIIGGGELFHLLQINFENKIDERIEYERGYIWKKPVALAQKYKIPYIFNGIGIPYKFKNEERAEISKAIEGAAYVGVRDVYSLYRIREAVGELRNVFLQPDGLWSLTKCFDENNLLEVRRKLRTKKGSSNEQKYIVIQYGTTYQYQAVVKELEKTAKANGWKMVFIPINYSHEDIKILQMIRDEMYIEADFYDELLQPIDIIALISGAEFFVGTSLHGNLVATLYGVKSLAIDMYGDFVSKIDGLLEWKGDEQGITIQPECICGDVKTVLKKDQNLLRVEMIKKELKHAYDLISQSVQSGKAESPIDINKGIEADRKCYFTFAISDSSKFSYVSLGKEENQHVTFDVVLPEKLKAREILIYLPFARPCQIEIVNCHEGPKQIDFDINVSETNHVCLERMAVVKLFCYEVANLSVTIKIYEDNKEVLLQQAFESYNNLLFDSRQKEREGQKREEDIKKLRESYERQKQDFEKERKVIQQDILNKQGHIEKLLQTERDLNNEINALKSSRTWRVAMLFQRISLLIAPEASIRRLILKMIFKLLRHPIRSIKMLSPRKIRHFFFYLREEGPGFVSKRMDESMQGIAIQSMDLDCIALDEEKTFDQYEKLEFVKQEHPIVSIVIPVYNQFAYTYNCLQSILNNSGTEISYEIIIANDCSTDDTTRLQEKVENILVVTNEKNLRFLKNCNHAAGHARGKFILFLNNDTQVQKDWLKPLVELMESDNKIGMVGSKLIYADGTLQEAGGIIWKDASAWNYGNRSDPSAPEFNYVKEVDYISGAAIMIRSSLWKEIGGFDEKFAPAYYEDTDLACEVRSHGYKVMYQPLSAVIHFEGISNGTDVSSGQKSYQVENQKKFYEKWKNVLDKENYPNGEKVFLAKDRSGKKKTLLMVDHYVPMYDKDAGSRCMFYYLNLFVNMGYNIKFIGDNFYKHEPYTTRLQQMGIEVLYGNYYFANWKDWLKSNGKYFDYVFLSRPHISIKYIDFVREHTNAKIIYFGHDLHYLREMREYQLNGNEQSLKDSKEWKKTELELMRKADVSYYLSKVELEEIAKVDSSVKVRRVPINIYTDIPDIDYQAENREDIIFVGGFGHPPNVDAVMWLGETIMPAVWKKNPNIVLHVVGSKPPKEIQAFHSEHMIIHGFVSDEDLEEMYHNIKIAFVPLRYGAGIKGKIIEAMMRGIPMVTTTIGIEGIEGAEKIAIISDDGTELAAIVADLYGKNDELEQMAKSEHQYIIDNYSEKEAIRVLEKDFEFV